MTGGGDSKGSKEETRPINGASAVAVMGSLLGMLEKTTEENVAEREAEAKARQRALVVHTPHVLLDAEKDFVRGLGRNPDDYAAMMLIGQLQVVKNPHTGSHLFIVAADIPRGFFPDLESTVLNADASLSTAKFDKKIGCPMGIRIVLQKDALGTQNGLDMQKNVEIIMQHEGKTFGELMDAGYQMPQNQVPVPGGTVPG